MKPLIAAIFWTMANLSTDTMLVVDRDLKKPAAYTTRFTTELYLKRQFPVYATEVQSLTEAIDKAVKKLDKELPCGHPEKTGTAHTEIVILKPCDETERLNITLVTHMEGTKSSFSFALVVDETDVQRAQRKLLNFATYLNQ